MERSGTGVESVIDEEDDEAAVEEAGMGVKAAGDDDTVPLTAVAVEGDSVDDAAAGVDANEEWGLTTAASAAAPEF